MSVADDTLPLERARRHFTLIELLVVIAIIGILAALLMPSLAKAKEKARRATCMSVQRQLAIAATSYADDERGVFPKGTKDNFPEDHTEWISEDSHDLLMRDYGIPHQVWFCPNFSADDLGQHTNNSSYRIGYEYLVGRELLNERYGYELASRVTDPAGSPLIADLNHYRTSGSNKWTVYAHAATGGSRVRLFVDQGGGVDPTVFGVEGGNQVNIDGAGRWNTMAEMTKNNAHATSAGGLSIYGYWIMP